MLEKVKKIIFFILTTIFIIIFISNPSIIISSVNSSLNIFINNVFISLFPFFILADFLINYDYVYFLSKLFKFKYSYIILLSMISGLPSNSKYIYSLLKNKEISIKDASILLSISYFPNPMFVITTVGMLFLNNIKLGIVLLINIYLSNFILYIIYYRKLSNNKVYINKDKLSFSKLLRTSILNNINNLLVILGTLVFFTLISNIIFNYIDIPIIIESIINGLLEMTSGIKKISIINTNTNLKFILIGICLSFSSLSIITQSLSILSEYKIDIKLLIKNKLLLIIINTIINYIYIIFFM